MMKLRNSVDVPPGGWTYFVAETQTTIGADSKNALVNMVVHHMMSNNIFTPPDLADRIEHQICRRIPPDRCRIRIPKGVELSNRLSLGQIIAGTQTILSWVASGVDVSQEEADRRSDICSRCDANQDTADCSACGNNQVRDLVALALGSKQTKNHDKLFFCLSCGCALKASVWCPLEIQQKYMPKEINDRLPDDCWKKVKQNERTIELSTVGDSLGDGQGPVDAAE